MNIDFHYYATYCAAYLAGYTAAEAADIAYSAQFVDCCTDTFLYAIQGPAFAATTQTNIELASLSSTKINRQNITRIWSSFHFLPYDLEAELPKHTKKYLNKYRLICGPNGALLKDTVDLVKNTSLQAVGMAMHILADTWAHSNFAGTPSLVINNINFHFYDLLSQYDGSFTDRPILFTHNPGAPDNLEESIYLNTMFQTSEYSIMNLGHGRAGHLPDYSFIRYKYLPAWGKYEELIKDNTSDYWNAFCQLVYALKTLKDPSAECELNKYEEEACEPYKEEIQKILNTRQISSVEDWKQFGAKLTGQALEDFDVKKYAAEYMMAVREEKPNTFLGRFFVAAMAQKNMVTRKIYESGSTLAGISLKINGSDIQTIDDFIGLLGMNRKGGSE